MFELSPQQARTSEEPDSLHHFSTRVCQVLDELQIPESEMKHFGCFLESELDPELELIHHQEKMCLADYQTWKADPESIDKRTLFATSICKLLEMRPNLQHLSSKFADLQEDLGY